MDLKTWLDAERGRAKALAEHMDVSEGRVSQWKEDGVPTKHMKAVRDFTRGAVTLEEMVPDSTVEPSTLPGLPEQERARADDIEHLYIRDDGDLTADTRHPEDLGRVWVAVPRNRRDDPKPNAGNRGSERPKG